MPEPVLLHRVPVRSFVVELWQEAPTHFRLQTCQGDRVVEGPGRYVWKHQAEEALTAVVEWLQKQGER